MAQDIHTLETSLLVAFESASVGLPKDKRMHCSSHITATIQHEWVTLRRLRSLSSVEEERVLFSRQQSCHRCPPAHRCGDQEKVPKLSSVLPSYTYMPITQASTHTSRAETSNICRHTTPRYQGPEEKSTKVLQQA